MAGSSFFKGQLCSSDKFQILFTKRSFFFHISEIVPNRPLQLVSPLNRRLRFSIKLQQSNSLIGLPQGNFKIPALFLQDFIKYFFRKTAKKFKAVISFICKYIIQRGLH